MRQVSGRFSSGVAIGAVVGIEKRRSNQTTPAQAGGDSLPDWLQLPTEGFIEQSPATESAGVDSTWAKEPGTSLFIFTKESKPTSKRNVFTQFRKDPNCETGRMANTTRARCQDRLEMRRPKKFGEVMTLDFKVVREGLKRAPW